MAKKYTFKEIFVSVMKCLLFFIGWLAMQTIITSFAQVLLSFANPSLDTEALSELVLSKSSEILIISNILTIMAFSFIYNRRNKTLRERACIYPTGWGFYLNSIVLGVSFQYVIILVLNLVYSYLPKSWIDMLSENNAALEASSPAIEFLAVALMAPILEEILFRGLMLSTLRRSMPTWPAIIVSAVLFGVAHANPIGIIYATAGGILMGWLACRLHSIMPSIFLHIAFNMTSLYSGEEIPYVVIIAAVPITIYEIVVIRRRAIEAEKFINENTNKEDKK